MLGLSFDRITFNYGTDPIFSDLTWEVHDDRVVGLIGPNGCGKSTLLRLMAGEIVCDSGAIARRKGITIGFLHQEPQLDPGRTVWQVVFSSFTRLWQVEEGLGQIERALTDPKIYGDAHNLAQILEKQQKLLYEFDQLGGTRYEGLVRSILHSLGFSDSELLLPVEVLSGGQRKLAALARVLVNQPDMLLLDEPDNHLDLKAKTYLERLIRNYAGGVVIVSHDRYLLDLVVDEIVELEDGRLTGYPGNYSEYAFEKQMRMQRQQQVYQAQQKEITRLEQAAKRLMMWGEIYDNNKFSRRGKSILKNLEKVERFDKPVLNRKRMGLELAGWVGSNKVLEIVDLFKSYPSSLPAVDETIILGGINLLIRRGERVGLVGPNGAGKSLLFRLLLDQESPGSEKLSLARVSRWAITPSSTRL
jgi:ATP-binding cassette subfamily F protein 3